MNILSLQPNLQLYHNPDIDRAKFKREFPYPRTSNGAPNFPLATERARALLTAEMWAVHPLPEMYATFIVHDGEEEQNLAYALAAACFRATRVDPYGYVAPFEPWRLKGLLVIARLLSQTAPLTATGELTKTCPLPLLAAALEKMDQVTICECVLRLVMYYGPMAHSDDWVVMQSAREMLTDMESLEGRERESAMLQLWLSNPSHPEAQHFFEEMVYKPVMRLADIAMLVIARKMQNGGLEEKLLSRLK
jgi:SET and MYND domain-containing protein